MKKKEVNQNSKPKFSLLDVFLSIKNGLSEVKVAKKFNTSKQNISKNYFKKLKMLKFIYFNGYGVWELTEYAKNNLEEVNQILSSKQRSKLFLSLGMRSKTELHALKLSIPIINGFEVDLKEFGGRENLDFNNWIPQYLTIKGSLKLTLTKTTKKIVLDLESRNIISPDEVQPLIQKSLIFAHAWLKDKGITIDILEAKTKNMHLATDKEELEALATKGTKITVDLNRKANQVLPSDAEALAWSDNTPKRGIETNDLTYLSNLLLVPERLVKIKEDQEEMKRLLTLMNENMVKLTKNDAYFMQWINKNKK